MRLRNNPQASAILERSQIVIKSFPFQLPKNTTIELGMGKGQMITQLAAQNRHHFFIGIEKNATVAIKALARSKELGLHNFWIINRDISELAKLLRGKAQTIWLTFSDPWPKARHEKRRLTAPQFLALYEKLLAKDGVLRLKTDNDAFFAYSRAALTAARWKLAPVSLNLHSEPYAPDNITTEYELKWSQKGKKINYLEARK